MLSKMRLYLVSGTCCLLGTLNFAWLDCLHHCVGHVAQAMAAHNSGGTVVVQVERLVERGSLPQRAVHMPGAIVDKVRAYAPAVGCF